MAITSSYLLQLKHLRQFTYQKTSRAPRINAAKEKRSDRHNTTKNRPTKWQSHLIYKQRVSSKEA